MKRKTLEMILKVIIVIIFLASFVGCSHNTIHDEKVIEQYKYNNRHVEPIREYSDY